MLSGIILVTFAREVVLITQSFKDVPINTYSIIHPPSLPSELHAFADRFGS